MPVFRVMNMVVLGSEEQKKELVPAPAEGITWITDATMFLQHSSADAFIDLLYMNTGGRNVLLKQLSGGLVFINSVTESLQQTDTSFVRFNGWNSFLSSPIIEAACINEEVKDRAEVIFSHLGKKVAWLPDSPGFYTARVVSMIINEAYLALDEGVSTREEINTAMKLGTAYPYGPFEWAEKIGVHHIAALLTNLAATEPRYKPASLLLHDAGRVT